MSDNKKQKEPMTLGSFIGSLVLVGLIILLFVGLSNCAKKDDGEYFRNMMRKDPSTWTQAEKNYYNNFSEWRDKQQNK